jgi:hypothetical protein
LTIENAQDSILGASINDLAGTESGEVGVWADVLGRQAEGDSDATALGYDDEMKGGAGGVALSLGDGSHIGLDASYDSSKLEAALHSRADVDVNKAGSENRRDSFQIRSKRLPGQIRSKRLPGSAPQARALRKLESCSINDRDL